MDKRGQILDEIIERELAMFLATPNEGGMASCQERPDTFRLMRKTAHSAHGDEYLGIISAGLAGGRTDEKKFYAGKICANG